MGWLAGHHQDQDEAKIEMEQQQLSRESLANLMTTHKVLTRTDGHRRVEIFSGPYICLGNVVVQELFSCPHLYVS